jgi:FixJ family two-component response regulator
MLRQSPALAPLAAIAVQHRERLDGSGYPRGLSNKEIAERLVISPRTVASHAEHIYAKINAPTRAAAGLFAMQHGLLPEEGFPASARA